MGMTFNLNGVKGTAVVRLKAWSINDVVFKGLDIAKGTNKDGKDWKAMKIKFSGEEGIFEPMIFCPGEGGDERPSGETNGKPWELASAMEQLQYTIAHLIENLAPEMKDKFVAAVSGLSMPEDFDKLVGVLNKVLAKSVNKQTRLKLVGNSKGYASLPNFVSINKDGDAYISNSWLGDTVAFSDYEVKQMERQKNAKPTDTDSKVGAPEAGVAANADLDFEV